MHLTISHLKKEILVQVRGGAEFKTAGILKYFEDFKRGSNKEIGPKDFFEIASNILSALWQAPKPTVYMRTLNG